MVKFSSEIVKTSSTPNDIGNIYRPRTQEFTGGYNGREMGNYGDLDVNPNDPANFYVAYASGGLWETKNHGNTFTPLFDNQMVMTIGDIKVDWNKDIIYVGSGENNSSRSSYSGNGIYK